MSPFDMSDEPETPETPDETPEGGPSQAQAGEKPTTRVVHDKERLDVVLTEAEIAEFGKRAARARIEAAMIEIDLKSTTKTEKAKIEALEARAGEYDAVIVAGRERRIIEITRTFDYPTTTLTVTRDDTGEVIEVRAMKHSELEMLPMSDPPPEDEAEGLDDAAEAEDES